MLKRFLTAAAPLALLAMASVPAHAADYAKAGYAPVQSNVWSDLTMAAGFGRRTFTDTTSTDTDGVIAGEGRFGIAIGGGMLQLDFSGDDVVESGCTDCNNPTIDLAAHFGMMAGPLGGLGLMVSVGDTGWSYWDSEARFATIAGEGTWALGFLGAARLTAQLGWTADITNSNLSVGYIHGVVDWMAGQNVMLSINLGYASDSNSNVVWRYGAKAEMQILPVMTGFIKWDGAHITNGSFGEDQNKFLIGATFGINESLATRSPFQDFNPATGINHLFNGS